MCERRSVGICCHDSPHDEAARPCLRTFHTASLGTSVNNAVPLAAAVSGWGDRRLARSRLALAVGAHFVPSAADVHVAPASGAVLRGVVEGPVAPLVSAGLQSLPLALRLRPDHLREQTGHDALGRTIPGGRLQGMV